MKMMKTSLIRNNDFITHANNLLNESLIKTEAVVMAQISRWQSSFAEHFQAVCADIVSLQNKSMLSAISHIEYTMLYTNFINRNYVSEVWVYGGNWYLDKNQRMVTDRADKLHFRSCPPVLTTVVAILSKRLQNPLQITFGHVIIKIR